VFLHGFPELAESWRDVLPLVAGEGFFTIAPDLRGYGQTDKPRTGYDGKTLAFDIVHLIDAKAGGRAHLIGHDWGGAIAYHVAALHPERVDRLAVVNCPHPAVMMRRIWSPAQLGRSWYIFFFQLPFLPEWMLSRNGGAAVARMLRGAAVDKTNFTRERLAPYAANFADPQVAHAGVQYYREAFRDLFRPSARTLTTRYPKIRAPFRLIWGEKDAALGKQLTYGYEPYFEGKPEVHYLPDVGHFGPIEAPAKIAAEVVEHLRAGE
jgi:pimeloyl-ACP methyl ester carboxylesterase